MNLNKMLRCVESYSRQVAIIQSSGCGKSRMVHEAAKQVFTFPFNLRQDSYGGYAYPPPDSAVLDHFLKVENHAPHDLLARPKPNQKNLAITVAKAYFLWFLGAVFRETTEAIEKMINPTYRFASRITVAQWWNEQLSTDPVNDFPWRRNFYEKCIVRAKADSAASGDAGTKHFGDGEEAAARYAGQNLTMLKKKIDSLLLECPTDDTSLEFLLYFDEAHTLRSRVANDYFERTIHEVLESSLNHFLDHSLVSVFLSTNSSLAVLAPSVQDYRSTRVLNEEPVLQPPITETSFDCGPAFPLQPDVKSYTQDELSSVEFLANFGRPLWWTLIQVMKTKSHLNLKAEREILDLARGKLIGGPFISFQDATFNSRIAVLDVLLSFDYEPRCQTSTNSRIQDELVASHMRLMYSVPEQRRYARSGYSSEPILAEAACVQLYEWDREALTDTQCIILHEVVINSQLTDLGKVCELLGRDRFIKAFIRAVKREQPSSSPPRFSRGCKLVTLVKEMFVNNVAEAILASTPDNIPLNMDDRKSFRDVFASAVVRYTHWVKFVDDSALTAEALLFMYLRRAAIWCKEGQDRTHFLIPVCLDPSNPCVENMTTIFVQLKQCVQKPSVKVAINIDEHEIFPFSSERVVPYVSLVMDLGFLASPPDVLTRYKKRTAENPKARPRKKAKPSTPPHHADAREVPSTPSGYLLPKTGTAHHFEPIHPCYDIIVYGCSDAIYADILPNQRPVYEQILATCRMLQDHPRNDEASERIVKGSKPFFAGGHDFFHWTNAPVLLLDNGDDPRKPPVLGVMVDNKLINAKGELHYEEEGETAEEANMGM